MKTSFDTLWNNKIESRCPFSDQQLEHMVTLAKSRQPKAEALKPVQPRRHAGRWPVALAAAACLLMVVVPASFSRARAAVPSRVEYGGQQVQFICNHQCDADGVIQSLDAYIQKS